MNGLRSRIGWLGEPLHGMWAVLTCAGLLAAAAIAGAVLSI